MAEFQPTNRVVQRTWHIWAWSFAINTALGAIEAVQMYYSGISDGGHPDFRDILTRALLSFWIYAAMTPPVLWLCWRYPIQRKRFGANLALHTVASFVFTAIHVSLRIALYPIRSGGQIVPVSPALWRSLFLYVVDRKSVV